MYKQYGMILLVFLSLGFGFESSGKRKKRKRTAKWSVSISNGYTFYSQKKSSVKGLEFWSHLDGQMNTYFSSLEVGRNFGSYEVGGRLQFLGPSFVSPYLKWNIVNKNSRNAFKPSLTFGVVPSHLMGGYVKFNLGLAVNSYFVLNPFVGFYAWYRLKDIMEYEKSNYHVNAGLSLSMYF